MRNYSFLWVLLLVYGVSGAAETNEEISVTEGGTLTLQGFPGVQRNDTIQWKFEGSIKVRVLEAENIHKYSNDKLTGSLKLDSQTGSLTITNITSDHAGNYELEIKKNDKDRLSKIFLVTVKVYLGVKSMSKMEGDSFPLYIDVKEREVHQIQWKFGDQVLNTDRLNDPKWSNIQLNNKTGILTIKHIKREQFGYYEVRINTRFLIFHGEFRITVERIAIQFVSVKEGEPVTLHYNYEIQIDDQLQLMFAPESTPMAEIKGVTYTNLHYEVLDERFRGRLKLDHQTASLTITNTRITDSGLYTVMISSSRVEKYTRFTVTVNKSCWSFLEIWGIVFSVLLVVIGIIFILWKCCWNKICCKRQRLRYSSTPNPMADPRAD